MTFLPDPMNSLDDRDYDNSPSKSPTINGQIMTALAKYGSTDNWPTLRIEPQAFMMCTCGQPRSKHKIGSDSSPCNKNGCAQFTWDGPIHGQGKRRRTT